MRIPTSETNDTLDAASLPPTDGTELNYRTRPDVETEIPFTLDALKFAVSVSVAAAVAVRFLVPEYLGFAAIALFESGNYELARQYASLSGAALASTAWIEGYRQKTFGLAR
jgi:hypothetical protein